MCVGFNEEFYYHKEHLGERFVEIHPSKERFSKFDPPKP